MQYIMTSKNAGSMIYPSTRREPRNVVFEHGAQIVDTYAWLENVPSLEVKDFETRQNRLTFDYLTQCPHMNEIKAHLCSMSKFKSLSCPTMNPETENLFFYMNDENENHDSLYFQRGLKGKPELLISPSLIPRSRHKFVLRIYSVSPDGKFVSYGYSLRNSNWLYVRFKEVATGKDFPEVLHNVCHSDISWTRDLKETGIIGIVYSFYINSNKPMEHKIAFHEIGTDQQSDVIFVEFPMHSELTLQAQISDCGQMIFVTAHEENEDKAYTHFLYGDLGPTIKNDYEVSPLLFHLLEGENLDIQYITNHNCITYFRTNLRAPNFRIVKTNLLHNDKLTKGLWETIIPNDPKKLLDWAVCVNGHYLMVCYIEDVRHRLQLHKLENGQLLHKYSLPIGTITEYFGSRHCSMFFFKFSSFLIPDRIYYIRIPEYGTSCQALTKFKYKKIRTFNNTGKQDLYLLSEYCLKQHFCLNQKDGELVPMFLIHRKKLTKNGETPCIMYGQGCFGVQVMPCFSIPKLSFLQCFDGIVAVVGVRGGGEYGMKWYAGGNKLKKQTTYDDFIAAAEYLIKHKYTSPSKLIVEGQLFGGNLAGACLVQRPDLFAAVIIHEGLLDLMRYHLFPISEKYIDEFGDPEVPIYFEKLKKLSPLHNILNENTVLDTPAVMLVIGRHPSLAHPSNSFKFIAELQHCLSSKSTQRNPFLLCSMGLDETSGEIHGGLKKIEERACIYSFLIQALGLSFSNQGLKKQKKEK